MTDPQDLATLTIKELRQLAGEHDIPNRSKLGKDELIDALRTALAGGGAAAAEDDEGSADDADDAVDAAFAPPVSASEPEVIGAAQVADAVSGPVDDGGDDEDDEDDDDAEMPFRTIGEGEPEVLDAGAVAPLAEGEPGRRRRRRRRRRGGRGRGPDGQGGPGGQGQPGDPAHAGHPGGHGGAQPQQQPRPQGQPHGGQPQGGQPRPQHQPQQQRPPQPQRDEDQRVAAQAQRDPNQRDPRGPNGQREPRDPNGPRDQREARDPNAQRDQREPRDPNGPRDQRDGGGNQPQRPPRPRLEGPQRSVPSVLDRLCTFAKGLLELCDPATPTWAQARLSELLAEAGLVSTPIAGVPHPDFHQVAGTIVTKAVPAGHIAVIETPGFALRGDRGDLFAIRKAVVRVAAGAEQRSEPTPAAPPVAEVGSEEEETSEIPAPVATDEVREDAPAVDERAETQEIAPPADEDGVDTTYERFDLPPAAPRGDERTRDETPPPASSPDAPIERVGRDGGRPPRPHQPSPQRPPRQDQPRHEQPRHELRQDQPRHEPRQDQPRHEPRQDQPRHEPRQDQPRHEPRNDGPGHDSRHAHPRQDHGRHEQPRVAPASMAPSLPLTMQDADELAQRPKAENFRPLGLNDQILADLGAVGYTDPTPIQGEAIPVALSGKDLIGQAQTGTGKTAAFVLPILQRLYSLTSEGPVALVLTPTRELAKQVHDQFVKMSGSSGARAALVYGGVSMDDQNQALSRKPHAVIGTPGRIIDHMRRKTLDLSRLAMVILDEADQMLDIGFWPDVMYIVSHTPPSRQNMLFSATFPEPIKILAEKHMKDPVHIRIKPRQITVEEVDQKYIAVPRDRKNELLAHFIDTQKPQQLVVFCRTKHQTDRVAEVLKRKRLSAGAIHGDLPQSKRERMLQDFRNGQLQSLIATNVAARGLDIPQVSHVVNYDIPENPEEYVHRIGRTARMGAKGVARTFITPEDGQFLLEIEKHIGLLLEEEKVPGFELAPVAEVKRTIADMPVGQPRLLKPLVGGIRLGRRR